MRQYVAFLRGINVGGVRIKMAALRDALTEAGLADVQTVLASGNVVFTTDTTSLPTLKTDIERALADAFGYDAWVILVSPDELQAVVDAYPFDEHDAAVQPYVMFTSDPTSQKALLQLQERLNAD